MAVNTPEGEQQLDRQRRARVERHAAELADHAVLAYAGDLSYWPISHEERTRVARRFVEDVVGAALPPNAYPWATTPDDLLSRDLLERVTATCRRGGIDERAIGIGAVNCGLVEMCTEAAVALERAVRVLADTLCVPAEWKAASRVPAGELVIRGGARNA